MKYETVLGQRNKSNTTLRYFAKNLKQILSKEDKVQIFTW